MNCSTIAPQTLGDFLDLINTCAPAYGGTDWHHQALLGLIGVIVILMVPVAALIAFRKL